MSAVYLESGAVF